MTAPSINRRRSSEKKPVPALKFVARSSQVEHLPSLPTESGGLLALKKAEPGTAFVIRHEDMGRFLGSALHDEVEDRGWKGARHLAKVLLGHEKIPLIETGYKVPGKLHDGIRRFLEQAEDAEDLNIYILGVSKSLYLELGPPRHESTTPLLERLLPMVFVPEALEKAFVGRSKQAQWVRQFIVRAAATDDVALILGDTGTGKEVVARWTHRLSERTGRFVDVNCGAIPRELFESELFGSVPGAYTDARRHRKGLWVSANHGTLFLDEIGDLALDHQVKILRALEEGKVRPVGAEESVDVNARVIAATNRDLFAMVDAGEFRKDLYYRLWSFVIFTPALHPDDVPLLADSFWRDITNDESSSLDDDIRKELKHHSWPGNARELRSTLTNLHSLFRGEKLGLDHLKFVVDFRNHAIRHEPPAISDRDIHHRMDCLRHLRRVDGAARALRRLRETLTSFEPKDTKAIANFRSAVHEHLNQLEFLCLHPLLFESDVPSSIERLNEKVECFELLLKTSLKEAQDYWNDEVEKALQQVLEDVYRALDRRRGES